MSFTPEQREQIRTYLKSGEIPDGLELPEGDEALNAIQAIYLRKAARDADTEDDAQALRAESREMLQRTYSVVDPEVLARIFDFETPVASSLPNSKIITLLQSLGYSRDGGNPLPVPSGINDELVQQLQQYFDIQVVPVDQLPFTDFDNLLAESQVPEWYRQIMANRDETEMVNIFSELKERWFLFVILILSFATIAGFVLDWGVQAQLTKDFVLFLSIYGGVAIGRQAWQTERAERWQKQAHAETRTPIVEAFASLVSEYAGDDDATILIEEAQELLAANQGWDQFQIELGLKQGKLADRQSPLRGLAAIIQKQYPQETVEEIQAELVKRVGHRVIDERLGGWDQAPSVAVVIPTYQTPVETMERLLLSIKHQIYPVRTVYVAYNDDPNGSPHKQAEFNAFQQLVDEMNNTPGNNQCQVVLLAQPSRGKREAMAAGFVMAMGRDYAEQVTVNYYAEYRELYLQEHPDAEEPDIQAAFEKDANNIIANFPLNMLPKEGHDRILNIDSDSHIEGPFSLLTSELMMQAHPNAGVITGDVRVETRGINLLTEMTYQRYWTAFFKERGSQSLSGQVTCGSGPWLYMDAKKLGEFLPNWYYYEHIAGRATFGDDREITTRMLQLFYESLFNPDSAVWTDCPTNYEEWLRQQLRWNKSFTIYNMVLFGFIHKLDKYVQLDVVYQQTFPFALLFIMSNIAVNAAKAGIENGPLAGLEVAVPYALTVLLFNELFFGVYGAVKNKLENEKGEFVRDKKFLMSPVYIYYHFRYLLWKKLYSYYDLFWKRNTAWGTKGEEFDQVIEDFRQDPDGMGSVDSIADDIVQSMLDGDIEDVDELALLESEMPEDLDALFRDANFNIGDEDPDNFDSAQQ